jgi:hypothetical protein
LCLYRVVFSIPAKESRPASVELTVSVLAQRDELCLFAQQ